MLRRALLSAGVVVLLAAVVSIAADLRLPDAAQQGDIETVRSLLKQKVDVSAAQGDGMTALHWAAYRDNVEMAQILVQAGANLKAKTREGAITPLYLAATNGNAAMIDVLTKAGADVNLANGLGTTPLMQAAGSGNVDAVKVLLDRGANINAKDAIREQTPLMFAASLNRSAVISLLIARGADLKAASKVVPIERALFDDDGNPIPQRYTKPGMEEREGQATVMGGWAALHYAAREGQMDAMRTLVEAGADVNQASGAEKMTPMVEAIINGHYDLAKYLLDRGGDPNITSIDGLAALYAAIDAQWAPVAWSPVAHTAADVVPQQKMSHLDLMKALLEKGADPNARLKRKLWFRPPHHDQMWVRSSGSTPFWRAAQATDLRAMKLLMAYGADGKIPSKDNDTPLMVAAGVGWVGNFSTNAPDGFLNCVKYVVEEVGVDVNAVGTSGYTAVMGAAYRGDNEMVKYLVEKGANLDKRTERGWSVTDFAMAPNIRSSVGVAHPETVSLLTKLGAPALIKVDDEEILGIIKRKIDPVTGKPIETPPAKKPEKK